MKTPDFVIDFGDKQFDVVDAKYFSLGDGIDVVARTDELASGMKQVNEAKFLPAGAHRRPRLAVGILTRQHTTDTAIRDATRAAARDARDQSAAAASPGWVGVDLTVERVHGRRLAPLLHANDYR